MDVLMEAAGGWVCQSGLSEAVVVKGLTADPEADSATRIGWKFGCTRGVAGTPTFFGETSQPREGEREGSRQAGCTDVLAFLCGCCSERRGGVCGLDLGPAGLDPAARPPPPRHHQGHTHTTRRPAEGR